MYSQDGKIVRCLDDNNNNVINTNNSNKIKILSFKSKFDVKIKFGKKRLLT